jgi:uncharacterized membrane protein HdeD (DUF308 family)
VVRNGDKPIFREFSSGIHFPLILHENISNLYHGHRNQTCFTQDQGGVMKDSTGRLIFGAAMIVFGALLLLVNFSEVSMRHLWPIFPLLVGGGMIFGYLNNRENVGFLMPGTVLIIISLLFFYCAFDRWEAMSRLWPIFILAPGVGFLVVYFGGTRDRGLLMPAGILGLIGFVFLAVNYKISNFIPILMILIGLLLILSQLYASKNKGET